MRPSVPLFLGLSLLALLLASTALAGGPIASGQVLSGSLSGPGFTEGWTFTGTAGDRVVLIATITSGTANTNIQIQAPGGVTLYNSSYDRAEVQLTVSGTYTVTVSDLTVNHAGSYQLSFLNITSGPLTTGSDADGGAIVSGAVKNAQLQQGADMDAWTFTAAAGHRFVVLAVETSGGFNTQVSIYPPHGGSALSATSANRSEIQIPTSGTWTVEVEDASWSHTGTYTVAIMDVTNGPFTTAGDLDGGVLTSGQMLTGTISGTADMDAYQFDGTSGDRVIFNATETGTPLNTYITIYPPGGGYPIYTTSYNRADIQLPATGRYTALVEDNADDETGTYTVSFLNITSGPLTTGSDPDGGVIVSGATRNGQVSPGGDMDAYTFTGAAGDRIVLVGLATSAAGFNTSMALYPPGGGAAVTSSSADRIEYQLTTPGTWTVEIEDASWTHPGTYTLALMNLSSGPFTNADDADGGLLASGDTKSASLGGKADLDAFQFAGKAGDRIVFNATETGGALNTYITLYPPNGGPALFTSSYNRADVQLTATGTYTALVEDNGDDTTGTYMVSFLNVTEGPFTSASDPDGGPILSGSPKSGQLQQGVDMDGWTFSGTAGDRIVLTAVALGSTGFNTVMYLYPPDGGPTVYSTSADRFDYQLTQSGTWTVEVEDASWTHTGSYVLGMMNVSAGPYTSAGDLDGGLMTSGDVLTGSIAAKADMDVYTFTGHSGDRVLFNCTETGGALNAMVSVYPPGGATAISSTTYDRDDFQLTTSGVYHVVVEDAGDDTTGNYTVSLLDITSGHYTNQVDVDGGVIHSGELKTGQIQSVGDMDAFQFVGNAGDRVVMDAVATAGAGFTPAMYLYPPFGGALLASTAGNRFEYFLTEDGPYVLEVEDQSWIHTGTYNLSMVDVNLGPFRSVGDANGGTLLPSGQVSAQIGTAGDLDGYLFYGLPGDTAKLTATAVSGTLNTMMYVYPPGGGAALSASAVDNVNVPLQLAGYYSVLVQDASLVNTGSYTLTLRGTHAAAAAISAQPRITSVALLPPVPNPSRGSTVLTVQLPDAGSALLEVCDAAGRVVRRIHEGYLAAGAHRFDWDGRGAGGGELGSGVYFGRLVAGGRTRTVRLVHLK